MCAMYYAIVCIGYARFGLYSWNIAVTLSWKFKKSLSSEARPIKRAKRGQVITIK
jgi:hypothetical protein